MPDKPSIAVLPFANMSGDPEQEYFADGIVEDIITALSRFDWLFVIARNSTFTYKGQAVDVQQVGRELGVRYVLEGSVRKAGNRVRITGAADRRRRPARHLWADRFDGALEDIFELQDQVTASVVGAIAPEAGAGRDRARPAQADREPRRLRLLPARHGRGAQVEVRRQRRGAACFSQGDRARSGLRGRLGNVGALLLAAQGQRLDRPRRREVAEARAWRAAPKLGPDDALALAAAGLALA